MVIGTWTTSSRQSPITNRYKVMKNHILKIFTLFAFGLVPFFAAAQQQPQNTQFMYYKLGYNPGFAGSQEMPCITGIFRQQWVGLEGAPNIQAITFNMPMMNQRVGVGANLYRHTVGITSMTNLDLAYAYRVRLGYGMLGIGVQGSIRSFSQDFNESFAIQDKTLDDKIPDNNVSKTLLNFGTGLYYNSDRFYIGISAPRLLKNDIDFGGSDATVSREVQHFYLMAGATIELNDKLKLQPQTLIKYVNNVPIDADINANLIINDLYIAGLTYRYGGDKLDGYGDSVDLLVAAQVAPRLMFGLSFDFTLSEVNEYTTGSIEGSLHYCIGSGGSANEFVNPRFF